MRSTFDWKWLSIDLVCEWGQTIGKYNWISIDIIKLYFEHDNVHGTQEVELYLLGFGIRMYWVIDKEKNDKQFEKYSKMVFK